MCEFNIDKLIESFHLERFGSSLCVTGKVFPRTTFYQEGIDEWRREYIQEHGYMITFNVGDVANFLTSSETVYNFVKGYAPKDGDNNTSLSVSFARPGSTPLIMIGGDFSTVTNAQIRKLFEKLRSLVLAALTKEA